MWYDAGRKLDVKGQTIIRRILNSEVPRSVLVALVVIFNFVVLLWFAGYFGF